MASEPHHPAYLALIKSPAYEALHNESERAVPLIGLEIVDDLLEKFLHAYFKQNGTSSDTRRLLLSGITAPLGSFAIRVHCSAAFGALDKDDCQAMNCLREIRNYCGHTPEVVSLRDAAIASQLEGLRKWLTKTDASLEGPPVLDTHFVYTLTPKDVIIFAVVGMHAILSGQTHIIQGTHPSQQTGTPQAAPAPAEHSTPGQSPRKQTDANH